MALIPYPVRRRHVEVALQEPVAVMSNESELTGGGQDIDLGASWWLADIAVAPMRVETAREWRLFLSRLRGSANRFDLPIVTNPQTPVAITADGGTPAGSYSIASRGWPASGVHMRAGDYASFGGQLFVVLSDVVSNSSGRAVIDTVQPIRRPVAAGRVIEVRHPVLRAKLVGDPPALRRGLAELQAGFSFSCREAYR